MEPLVDYTHVKKYNIDQAKRRPDAVYVVHVVYVASSPISLSLLYFQTGSTFDVEMWSSLSHGASIVSRLVCVMHLWAFAAYLLGYTISLWLHVSLCSLFHYAWLLLHYGYIISSF
jgi:hypothetical protein